MTDPLAKYETYKTDIKHPAWLVSCNPSLYRLHGTACDILALDSYPVRGKQATTPIICISDAMERGLAAIRGDKPIVFILQSFGEEPEDMMVNMAYQAVIHGLRASFGMHGTRAAILVQSTIPKRRRFLSASVAR